MNVMIQRYGKTIWSAVGIAGGLYLLGARGEQLVRYTAGAMVGAWIANMGQMTGVVKQAPLADKDDDISSKATG